jgi:hypothetical protein
MLVKVQFEERTYREAVLDLDDAVARRLIDEGYDFLSEEDAAAVSDAIAEAPDEWLDSELVDVVDAEEAQS